MFSFEHPPEHVHENIFGALPCKHFHSTPSASLNTCFIAIPDLRSQDLPGMPCLKGVGLVAQMSVTLLRSMNSVIQPACVCILKVHSSTCCSSIVVKIVFFSLLLVIPYTQFYNVLLGMLVSSETCR